MAINLLLRCNSVKQTRQFYSEILGFEISDSAEGSCTVQKEGGTLIFTDANLWSGPPVLSGTVYFFLADVDAYYAKVSKLANVQWPLEEMSYGTREFAVTDCNGYTLAFAQKKFNESLNRTTAD